ncbi:sugar phosphate isomerase/epimerase family protein [Bacillus sp. SD088]|uniref:sugar phosphate isomerase/epimerase family protein n=1 Tax=Bacillus sp. SD088 TaxID=2782012 RepID=UPI001A956C19|nr:sugar phosphate isomerase/epimerase family protein [Bacillus sp. SD088]MBO0992379.1 sugar phosphate isomerase/epimerase [Bacillus sp. SD088]
MFPFKTSLNASTLFPFELDVIQQIEVTKQAGYDGIELWMRDIDSYLENGGSIQTIQTALKKNDLELINAIAFFKWADEDQETREAAFKQAKEEMELLASIDCLSIAAPPFGEVKSVTLDKMAQSFDRLVTLGRKIGVEPLLEFWGRSQQLSTLEQAQLVLKKLQVTNGKLLIDPFHMYVGGSNFANLQSLQANQIGIVHVNDYPSSPSKEEIEDADRVFPGEGMSDTFAIGNTLTEIGYKDYLSLELFITDYENKSALEVAQHGLNTLKKAYT